MSTQAPFIWERDIAPQKNQDKEIQRRITAGRKAFAKCRDIFKSNIGTCKTCLQLMCILVLAELFSYNYLVLMKSTSVAECDKVYS